MLNVSTVRAFRDNYIWLVHAPAEPAKVIAVDPGEASPVEEMLARENLDLAAIFATHHHHDHVGGIADLCAHRDIPVFGPRAESVPHCSHAVGQGDTASLDNLGLHFSVLDIPAHTAGHIAFSGHGAVFCGDTLFSAGCGRLFEGSPEQMLTSLAKLAELGDDTQVFCGHEYTESNLKFALHVDPDNQDAIAYQQRCKALMAERHCTLPSTIGLEKQVNPFLRCDTPRIRAALKQHTGRSAFGSIEAFAELRAWKDTF